MGWQPLRIVCVFVLLAATIQVAGSQGVSGWMEAAAAHEKRSRAEQERASQIRAAETWRRSSAHARLQPFVRPGINLSCPVYGAARRPAVRVSRKDAETLLEARHFQPFGPPTDSRFAPATASLAEIFTNFISGPVVQARCIYCHVEGGLSGHTRLVLSPATVTDHESKNLAVFQDFTSTVEGGADVILNKIQGVAHGGGVQVPAGSEDFANMERFLRLLGGSSSGGISPVTLFDGVTMASPSRTLRRAALVFAGRLPTQAELNAVQDGREATLRGTIRNLMSGPGFHEFLLRGSNDRLLTDRALHGTSVDITFDHFLVNMVNENWKRVMAVENKNQSIYRDESYTNWRRSLNFGLTRAPLELIAHVIENDLPYTEILTADYIMANPFAAKAYGASTQFENVTDIHEFKKAKIVDYYRTDKSKIREETSIAGSDIMRVTNPGNLKTDYPHAGILNTNLFLFRYPTTATNRNRARSRWTYYYFLGHDIEKSAARTTDPVALADTNNPTMNNSACTVCHAVMDPVAGAFQNYGDEGWYRDQWGGHDSLHRLYKDPEDGSVTPYQQGDTWYRDMRAPGFGGKTAPNADNSVQWLAEQIVADDRFAEAAVKFWWPVVMGSDIVAPPENSSDSGFDAVLLASSAQALEVARIAERFRNGIPGGQRYNGKDLLADIALSPWFRAESLTNPTPVQSQALRSAGVGRLLTPEELRNKTEAITGFVWNRFTASWKHPGVRPGNFTDLEGSYKLLYGGIDSDGIISRTTEVTPLMSAVAQSHAIQASCPIVFRELVVARPSQRKLLDGISLHTAPDSEASGVFNISADGNIRPDPQIISLRASLRANEATAIRVGFTNDAWVEPGGRGNDRNLTVGRVVVRDQGGTVVQEILPKSFPDKEGCKSFGGDTYRFFANCTIDLPISLPADGEYKIEVFAWQDAAGSEPAKMSISVVGNPDPEVSIFDVTTHYEVRPTPQVASLRTPLRAAAVTGIRIGFTNDYWEEPGGIGHDRNLLVGPVTIRDKEGTVVREIQPESFGTNGDCPFQNNGYSMKLSRSSCTIEIPVSLSSDGQYAIDVQAWQNPAGSDPARMSVTVVADPEHSSTGLLIRRKLADLHQRFLGIEVSPDSVDVDEAFRLFVDVWKRNDAEWSTFNSHEQCDLASDHFFFEGLDRNPSQIDERGYSTLEWSDVQRVLKVGEEPDPFRLGRSWIVVLSYLMTDYRYLHL